jgi:two-component system, NarL family, nitrate/nitrite response regulator NarL
VRILLCDDHRLFVEPVAAALAARGHEALVATTPAQALEDVDEFRPDLVVVDLYFPGGGGLPAVASLRSKGCRVVVLSASADPRDEATALRAGAAAYVRKDQPLRAIFDVFDLVAAGREVSSVLPAPESPPRSTEHARVRRLLGHLTQRERQTLKCLLRAQDTAEIAQTMGVAPSTARTHLQTVLLKLGVHTRLQAVSVVVAAGVDGEL